MRTAGDKYLLQFVYDNTGLVGWLLLKCTISFLSSILSPEHQRPRSLILEHLPEGVILPPNSLFGAHPSVITSSGTPATEASSGSGPTSCTGKSPSMGSILFVPEMEEVRVSPIVSKRGYLNVLEQKIKVRA